MHAQPLPGQKQFVVFDTGAFLEFKRSPNEADKKDKESENKQKKKLAKPATIVPQMTKEIDKFLAKPPRLTDVLKSRQDKL